jgi:predicted DNA-binding transcriptional regulator AlpA
MTREMPSASSARARPSTLPMGTPPRGFNREQSAEYVGVSATKFDQMVTDGRMPKPKRIDGRVVWDRLQLDSAFAALPDEDGRVDDVWSKFAV